MSLLEHLNAYSLQPALQRLVEETDLDLVADHSGFVVVDGEEGDHGVIRYNDTDGRLVAVKTVHGGDSEDFELTSHGAEVLKPLLLKLFTQALELEVRGNPELS